MPRALFFFPLMALGLASYSDRGHPTTPMVDNEPSF